MSKGKEKCEKLRAIRRQIAERYNLEYNPTECTHTGDCLGTCPRCDAELHELQKQLEQRGIGDIDLNIEIQTEEANIDSENSDIKILQGDIIPQEKPETIKVTMGMPAPPEIYKYKKRILYKECQIAGTTFHHLNDIWDELYEGAELALVRQKNNRHDKNAVAVALTDDFDGNPDDFDFDFILGYVPRVDNEHLANMLDLGWADAFECELSRISGTNPHKGSLYMKIYLVSKNEEDVEDTSNLLRAWKLDYNEYQEFISDLSIQGCAYFRWGGFPPWERKLPEKSDKVVFLHKGKNETVLHLMYCIAVGDDDASYFVDDKESLHAVDDCCYFVFTNVKGPILIPNEQLVFLEYEEINENQPEAFLSEDASLKLRMLLNDMD